MVRKIFNPFKRKEKRSSSIVQFLNSGDCLPQGYTRLSDTEEVKQCVHKIADLVSNMTIMLMQNGANGDIRVKNELSKKIDISPCSDTTRKNFIYSIVWQMCMNGQSIVYPEISAEGFIDNLRILGDCSVVRTPTSYRIRYQGTELNPDDVLHFVLNPKPDEPHRGCGIAPLLKDTVVNIAQANKTKRDFLHSQWKPSLIISVNSDAEELMDPEKRDKIAQNYIGTAKAGEPWIIPAGEMQIEKIQPLTLSELAIQDSITLDTSKIARAIGVPPFMVGIGTFNKDEYNNFISTTIMSFAMLLQQEMTKKLLYAPDLYFKFNPKSLMQYNITEKVQFVKEMMSGGMLSRNEGRVEFDYAPVDNPGMNDYIVLENYVPVDKVGDQKKLKGGDDKSE